uniref:Tify domain-containing protein n=1 Tax=Oryza punctata TaxID=4537 RepID=A0A0E0MGI3_ORYPU
MDNPTPSSNAGGGAAAANASSGEHHKTSPVTAAAHFFDEEHPFDDILLPMDLFDFTDGLDDGHGCYVEDQAAIGQKTLSPAAEQQLSPAAEHGDEERLVMYYHGQEYVFDSVQPQKIENIFQHLNGQEMIPQSIRPQPTNLVRPITVPENFDRFAALTRYREKKRNIKFIKKADYSARKEVALSCTNCGESSDATPMMRHGPNGTKSFCNACGLMWANSRKIRKIKNPTSEQQEDQQFNKYWIYNQSK